MIVPEVVFPRDKPGQDVPLSLCPGTKKFSCPGVPLSRDKGRSKCPGTNSSVPGRPGTKWIKNFQKNDQISCFWTSFSWFRTSFSCFRTTFSVLEHHFPVLERPFLLCPVLSRVPSRILAVLARLVPNFGYPGPSCPLARFLACPVVPLSQDNEGTSDPLSQKVAYNANQVIWMYSMVRRTVMDMYKHRIFIRLSLKGQFWNSRNVAHSKLSNIENKCIWAVLLRTYVCT